MKKKVAMFVLNNFTNDARVLKEARTLTQIGYDVRVIAVLDNNTIPYEERDDFNIIRIKRDPIHHRLFRFLSKLSFRRYLRILLGFKKDKESPDRYKEKRFSLKRIFSSISLHYSESISRFKEKNTKDNLMKFPWSFFLAGLLYIPIYCLSIVFRKIVKVISKGSKFFFRKIKLLLIKIIKGLLMPFHKFFSLYDFYCRSYSVVNSDPAEIYHAHDLSTLPVAWYAKQKLGGKLIYDSHELYTETSSMKAFEKKLFTLIERKLIVKCDQVITVCDSIADELKQRYKVASPTIVMNCPSNKLIVKKHNLIRELTLIPENEPIILYQGGFSLNRGLHNLIESSKYIPKGKLVFMGWGKIEEELKLKVAVEGLSEKIYFIPPVPQDQLLYWSSSADIGVIPYQFVGLNNYYSCPNKLFEYTAAGIAVAGSNFPELSRVINGFKLGTTFDPEDPNSIAKAINTLIDNEQERQICCENARKAREVLNWECESKKLLNTYSEIDNDLQLVESEANEAAL